MTAPAPTNPLPHDQAPLRSGGLNRAFLGWAAGIHLVITLAMFGPLLAAGPGTVISLPDNDIANYFAPLRAFGFGHFARHGLPPFWNPHVFAGTPYFANPQSATLYPPNLLHLFLPVATAINAYVALHFFLTGLFTACLARSRGLSTPAAVFAGAAFPLTGGYVMHAYIGHLGILAFCWTPFILLVVDRITRAPSAGWLLAGAGAVALTLLAGHPQMAYYTALVAGLYLLAQLPPCRRRTRALLHFILIYALGAGLAAIQLVPIFFASRDYLRSAGTSYDFATTGSLPPESLLTLLIPRLFGVWHETGYAGRYLPWETGVYCGTGVFLLAAIATFRASGNRRLFLVLLAACLILASGGYLPTYRLLYRVVPWLDHFRVPGRFKFFVDLFLVLLAGQGLDLLLTARRAVRPAVVVFGGTAVVLFAASLWLSHDASRAPAGAWAALARTLAPTAGPFVPTETFTDAALVQRSGGYAARQAFLAAVSAGALAVAAAAALRWPRGRFAVATVAFIELFLISRTFLVSGPIAAPYPPEWTAAQEQISRDQRVLTADLALANRAMVAGAPDLYGYDPLVLRRYAEFIASTQGADVDTLEVMPHIRRPHALFQLLRCRFVLARPVTPIVLPLEHPLPRALLVPDARVMNQRSDRFAALADPTFDPTRSVVLESAPAPAPISSEAPGDVTVLSESPDALEVRATVRSPAILLITDAFAPGWTARSLSHTPPQPGYTVMPADCTLRAIPLAAGDHHLLIRYVPPGLVAGAAISIASVVAAGVLAGLHWRRLRVSAGPA